MHFDVHFPQRVENLQPLGMFCSVGTVPSIDESFPTVLSGRGIEARRPWEYGCIGREKIDLSQRNVLVSHQFYLPVGKQAEEVERMDAEIRCIVSFPSGN